MSDLLYYQAQGHQSKPIVKLSSNDEQEAVVCYPCQSSQELDNQPSSPSPPSPSTPFLKEGFGVTRMPCKARGLKNHRNARNAYIEIPTNPSHGLILVCSNAECVSSGRRFRYCAVCHTPVAKRNFMVRHCHGFNLLGLAKGNVASAGCVQSLAPPSRHEKIRSRCVSQDSREMASMAKQAMQGLGKELASEERPTKMMKLASSQAKVMLTPEDEVWLSLLDSRSNFQNADASSKWLDSVVACAMPQGQESEPFPIHSEFGSLISGCEDILSVYDDAEELDDSDEDFLIDFDTI